MHVRHLSTTILAIAALCLLLDHFGHEPSVNQAVAAVEMQSARNTRQAQRESVLVDLAGTRARLAELDRQIKLYKDERQTKLKTDPIAAELKKIVDPLQKVADQKRAHPETYTEPDLERADMEVAVQRTHLLEREDQFGDESPLLEQLRHDRITLATELAELEARARTINENFNALRDVAHESNSKSASKTTLLVAR